MPEGLRQVPASVLRYSELIERTRRQISEMFPWDLAERLEAGAEPLLIDVREPYEFQVMRLPGSINVPRGILEQAVEWGFEETVPDLVRARERDVVLLCRSGNRSVLAARSLQDLGFVQVCSLRTGLRGWNDYEQPLVDAAGREVDIDAADDYFAPQVTAAQRGEAE